jgi:hypothetical protein
VKLSVLDDLLWALGFLLSAILLMVLIWRGRWRRFPIFTAWIAFATGKTLLLYVIYRFCGRDHLYAQVYWLGLWPEFALQVGTAIELARAALRRSGKWVGDARKLFLFASACGIVVSALLSEWISPPRGLYASWELRADLFISLVLCELLVSVSLIANWLRLAWERHVLAIAEGLIAFSGVSLVVNALQSYLGTQNFRQIEYFQSYAWIGATAWIAMELGLPNPNAGCPAPQSNEESSRQTPEKIAPGMLRPLPASCLRAVRKLFARRVGVPGRIPPTSSATCFPDEAGT